MRDILENDLVLAVAEPSPQETTEFILGLSDEQADWAMSLRGPQFYDYMRRAQNAWGGEHR